MKQLRPCSGCKELCIHREGRKSFHRGTVRACPFCESICVERGPSYKGRCLQCGMDWALRQLWRDYPKGAVFVILEEPCPV